MSLALAGLVACTGSWAQFSQTDATSVTVLADPSARLEFATSSVARPDRVEAPNASQRLDMTLLPPRRSAIGLAVGVQGFSAPPTVTGAGLMPATQPAVDVGVHWRHTLDSNYRIDVTTWRRMPQQDLPLLMQQREPTYGARVELNLNRGGKDKADWKERGIIGMQLDNGARVSIRRKFGGPMIYYRNTF